ncbi:MAG: hypothetical protein A3H27_12260 [Acidobacteria bacterium RIFCSPLOWO2_02_FULL_59_13]|nr:MAG: hypothetical protein A3H27_12260 [Acidobacteria bacterium RIFCSPLOWO2_02_FULL_59_13]
MAMASWRTRTLRELDVRGACREVSVCDRSNRDFDLPIHRVFSPANVFQRIKLGRDADGRYHLVKSEQGRTAMIGVRGHDPQTD